MGYRTTNEESHECDYCGTIVERGKGVLLKYSPTQSDDEIVSHRFTYRVGHVPCVKKHGSSIDKEALKSV